MLICIVIHIVHCHVLFCSYTYGCDKNPNAVSTGRSKVLFVLQRIDGPPLLLYEWKLDNTNIKVVQATWAIYWDLCKWCSVISGFMSAEISCK